MIEIYNKNNFNVRLHLFTSYPDIWFASLCVSDGIKYHDVISLDSEQKSFPSEVEARAYSISWAKSVLQEMLDALD